MKVVFFGTPPFAANVLNYLLENGVNVVAVITKPDRPQGRSGTPVPTPVKVTAQQYGLPFYQPELVSAPDFAPTLQPYEADLFVVVAYGEIIKQHLLDMPKIACINLHGSLLPKYRGAAPIQHALIDGQKETGVTVIHMVKKMDAGDMVSKATLPIEENMTYGELEQALCQIGAELLLQTIRAFEKNTPPRIPQNESEVTFAPKIELEDCQIKWHEAASDIHNLIRGVTPHPGAWCQVNFKGQSKRLRVITTRVVTHSSAAVPGTILRSDKEGLLVSCGQDALLIIQVQLEGKKAMPVEEFLRGLPQGALTLIATF